MIAEDTTSAEDARKDNHHLHDGHVVGEAVKVTHRCFWGGRALFSPLLEAVEGDEDAGREEEDVVGDQVHGEDVGAWFVHEARYV